MEASLIERLQEVIEGVRLEGANRILIVGRGKNYKGEITGIDFAEHLETVEIWHLNVEQEQVGVKAIDSGNSLAPVLAFGNDDYIWLGLEQYAHLVASESFVIGDYNPQ
jgi:hypothetical protein